MAAVACAEAASLPVKMLAKVHQDLHQVSLYVYLYVLSCKSGDNVHKCQVRWAQLQIAR